MLAGAVALNKNNIPTTSSERQVKENVQRRKTDLFAVNARTVTQ